MKSLIKVDETKGACKDVQVKGNNLPTIPLRETGVILCIRAPQWSRTVRFGVRSRKLSNVRQSWDG
jgi:hypothetical protein